MKKKTIVLIFVIFASLNVFGQIEAKKFDEFGVLDSSWYYPFDSIDVSQRITRLANYVRRKRGITVFVVTYKARKSTNRSRRLLENWAANARSAIAYQTAVGDKNTFLFDGGFRDDEMIEFWIGTNNSKAPPLKSKFTDEYKFECADIYIGEKDMNLDINEPATFSASIYPERDVSFVWTPSVGEVVEGQGTSSVSVDAKGAAKVTLFVEVKGLPDPCEKVVFKTFEIGKRPFLFDETTRYVYSDLAARVDGFMTALNANPQLTGHIIAYAGRGKNDHVERDRALASVKRIFAFRRFETDRVKIVNGGFREYNAAEMWLLPQGVAPPKPTPSVDYKFIKVLRNSVTIEN